MNFYRRFPGDYARDTQHLSLIEHGIYNLLLDHAYATEKPIPDVETACRICRISSRRRPDCIRSGRLTVEKVLSAYFTYADAVGWTHKRVDEEIKYAESRRKKAEKGGEARWKDHAPSRLQECSKQPTDHAPRNAKSDSRFQSKRLSSSRHPQDHAASGGKPDDDYHQKFLAGKAEYLAQCQDPDGHIAVAIDIILERSNGHIIDVVAYLTKAMDEFAANPADLELLNERLKRAPL